MIVPLLSMIRTLLPGSSLSMELFYKQYNISRQGFHQALIRRRHEQNLFEMIRPLVENYRLEKDRRAGSRNLFYNLEIKRRFAIGVNKFERLLSENNLSLIPLRIKVVTTKSVLQSWNYKNLTNGLILRGINELVVGDLTYLAVGKYRYYMFCLIDAFSLKIVGYCLSNRMRKQEAIEALDMYRKQAKHQDVAKCIHHTDGGGQYFSDAYLRNRPNWMKTSVAKSCIENGLAEQKNGYIKNHLVPVLKFSDLKSIKKEMAKLIKFYNTQRKQQVLGWRTPLEVERQSMQKMYEHRYYKLHDHEKKLSSHRFGF